MSKPAAFCSSCGQPASGRFCSNCGAPLEPGAGAARGGARSGAGAAGPEPVRAGVPVPWVVAGGVVALVALGLLVWGGPDGAPATEAAPQAQGAEPPDLSQMSPRERFDRLFNRIMTAAEAGNTSEVTTFLPMATMAYAQLDSVNIDARYHLALLQIEGGNPAAALAQADSIAQIAPQHLFGFLIREAEAARRGDSEGVRQARAGFLAAYDREIALERVEYTEHRNALERVRSQ